MKKRYYPIEREALAVEFTTTRLQMYLLGAPKFQLGTDHKPLLPLFNNPTAKLPPSIGPPFNSEDFKEFAVEKGLQHKKVTPRHPKAQGQVECRRNSL